MKLPETNYSYRDSIVKALDILINDSNHNLSDEKKIGKLEAWHLGLHDVSDDMIIVGLKKALQKNDGFLLTCGQFRSLCVDDFDAEINEFKESIKYMLE